MAKNTNKSVLTRNAYGEFIYSSLNNDTKTKAKADSLLEVGCIPYILLVVLGAIDIGFFYSKLSVLSYDSVVVLLVQVVALFACFDLNCVYLGIQVRKIKDNLCSSKHNFSLILSLVVLVLGVVVNTVVTVAYTSYMNQIMDSAFDIVSLSTMIFNIAGPVITSGISFYVSYLLTDPLKNIRSRYEMMVKNKESDLLNIEALCEEYERMLLTANEMINDEYKYKEIMKNRYVELAIGYADYVADRLKEHIGSASACNALSTPNADRIVLKVQQQIAQLDKLAKTPADSTNKPVSHEKTFDISSVA